jgi:hypothetical protein
VPDANLPFDPMPFSVRSAVRDRIRHALQYRRGNRRAVDVEQSSDSAHGDL